MATLIERTDAAFNAQLKNCSNKISNYSGALALTAADVAALKADSLATDYIQINLLAVQTFSRNYFAYKSLLRNGGEPVLGALPVLAAFPVAPAMPAPDIEGRFRALVQRISR